MSMGYMPKKVKQAKRQQRSRKKHQNFSCKTCRKDSWCMRVLGMPLHPEEVINLMGNIEFCPNWKAPKKEPCKEKKTLKTILKKIF